MVIRLNKDTLSCRTCRRKIETALWVTWIELGFSGEFCDVGLSCIIYNRKPGLPLRDRFFENFRKSKYRSKFLIRFLGITHQRVSLEKLWANWKNWSCPEILDGYRKSLLNVVSGGLGKLAKTFGWNAQQSLSVDILVPSKHINLFPPSEICTPHSPSKSIKSGFWQVFPFSAISGHWE